MKIIKQINSPIMSTFVKNKFPKFKIIAIEYENGKIKGEVI